MSFKYDLSNDQTNRILNQANKVKFENFLPTYLHNVLEHEG